MDHIRVERLGAFVTLLSALAPTGCATTNSATQVTQCAAAQFW